MLDANDIFQMLGLVFGGCMLLLIWLAVWLTRKILPKQRKWAMPLAALVVVCLYGWLIVPDLWEAKKQQKAAEQRYLKAKSIFDERCKSAGEKIYKTVDDVEGITLDSLRPLKNSKDSQNQFWEYAALPSEFSGEGYIRTFLLWEHLQDNQSINDPDRNMKSYLNEQNYGINAYQYVYVKNNKNSYIKYYLSSDDNYSLIKQEANKISPYLIKFEDISSLSDRENWIAGGKITVSNIITGEILAESSWYSFESGFGNTVGSRSPWGFANTCPRTGYGVAPTRFFFNSSFKSKN